MSHWLEPELLDGALGRYACNWPQADRRAAASQWHQESIALILPPLLLARLLNGREVCFDPRQLRMTVDELGAPLELHLPDAGGVLDERGSGARQLEELCELLLEPFVIRFAARTGLAPRLLWGNAALCIDWALEVAQTCKSTRLLREARFHFLDLHAIDICRPLRRALRRNGSGVARRACCLRERLPMPRCSVCPLAPCQGEFNLPTQP
ncbi:siderophore-iron reductase FhuF [Pseudomonas sp. BN415]|uniref:siderophore-iron reductase FhuF n=1 Tax=Pseudomonas sp. BN415 TaxID=2567889 RepID=UPI0024571845|nr:siderophore-iron reductase FhuF [Pseudomonas sp. BN415]